MFTLSFARKCVFRVLKAALSAVLPLPSSSSRETCGFSENFLGPVRCCRMANHLLFEVWRWLIPLELCIRLRTSAAATKSSVFVHHHHHDDDDGKGVFFFFNKTQHKVVTMQPT